MAMPTVGSAQQGPRGAAATEVPPAGEHVSGSEAHSDFILPLIGIAVLILVIILVADHHHHNNIPTSP
jgi:hypothetical protein